MTTKKDRAEALARMTKAELIKTVKTLDARQVKLLNEIAGLRMANQTLADAAIGIDEGKNYLITRGDDEPGVVHVTQTIVGDELPNPFGARPTVPPIFPWEK